MIAATLIGAREVAQLLAAVPTAVQDSLLRRIVRLTADLQRHVVEDKLAGQALAIRSGGLRRSIAQAIEEQRGEILGRVGLEGSVPYGAIHEFGGRTPAHAIQPGRARVLAFGKDGKTVFAARVAHPGSAIPERSFLRTALAELTPEIHAALAAAVAEGLRSARP